MGISFWFWEDQVTEVVFSTCSIFCLKIYTVDKLKGLVTVVQKRHVNNIPTMHLFTGISRNTQSKLCMLSLTECVWDFRNNALWDTH